MDKKLEDAGKCDPEGSKFSSPKESPALDKPAEGLAITPILEKFFSKELAMDALGVDLKVVAREIHASIVKPLREKAEKMSYRIADLESIVIDRSAWQKGFESANRELVEVKKDRDAWKEKAEKLDKGPYGYQVSMREQAEKDADRLAELLKGYRNAQQDMLDDWAEGDRKVKDSLWCKLHDQERSLAAIEALAAHEKLVAGH